MVGFALDPWLKHRWFQVNHWKRNCWDIMCLFAHVCLGLFSLTYGHRMKHVTWLGSTVLQCMSRKAYSNTRDTCNSYHSYLHVWYVRLFLACKWIQHVRCHMWSFLVFLWTTVFTFLHILRHDYCLLMHSFVSGFPCCLFLHLLSYHCSFII